MPRITIYVDSDIGTDDSELVLCCLKGRCTKAPP